MLCYVILFSICLTIYILCTDVTHSDCERLQGTPSPLAKKKSLACGVDLSMKTVNAINDLCTSSGIHALLHILKDIAFLKSGHSFVS